MADAFYVSVGGSEVPLSYYDMDPSILKNVKKFPAFAQWVSSFKAHQEFSITKIEIQNIEWVGKRINGVKACIELTTASGEKTIQTMTTSEKEDVAMVLPMTADGHLLLYKRETLATLGQPTYTALTGCVSASGEVTINDAQALEVLGLTPSAADIMPLSDKAYHCSTGGSTDTLKYFAWNIATPPASSLPLAHGNGSFALVDQSVIEQMFSGPAPGKGDRITDVNTIIALSLARKSMSS